MKNTLQAIVCAVICLVAIPAQAINKSDSDIAKGFVEIPAGQFPMGSAERKNAKPVHLVAIGSFAMGVHEVSFKEYDTFCEATGCKKSSDEGWGRGKFPVIHVNWKDANAYASWLSEKIGKPFRLPTEAEWEYAARAGGTTSFSFELPVTTEKANYDGSFAYKDGPKGEYRQRTMPVESFKPNAWGLYDMHGNVQEWVADCYHGSYENAPQDGSGWREKACKRHVLRGGSWQYPPIFMQAFYRTGLDTDKHNASTGFRLVQEIAGVEKKTGGASPWKPASVGYASKCEGECLKKLVPINVESSHLKGVRFYVRPDINDAIAQLGDCLESIKSCVVEQHDATKTAACVARSQCPDVCKQAYATEFNTSMSAKQQLDGIDRVFLDDGAVCAPGGKP